MSLVTLFIFLSATDVLLSHLVATMEDLGTWIDGFVRLIFTRVRLFLRPTPSWSSECQPTYSPGTWTCRKWNTSGTDGAQSKSPLASQSSVESHSAWFHCWTSGLWRDELRRWNAFFRFQERTPESVNELNQLLDALGKAKETIKREKQRTSWCQMRNLVTGFILARTHRASSLTPSPSTSNMNHPSTKNAKSIDDLIESLNQRSETPKSNPRKKYARVAVLSRAARRIWFFVG